MRSESYVYLLFVVLFLTLVGVIIYYFVLPAFFSHTPSREPINVEVVLSTGSGFSMTLVNELSDDIVVFKIMLVDSSTGFTANLSGDFGLPRSVSGRSAVSFSIGTGDLYTRGIQLVKGRQYLLNVFLEGWEEPFTFICLCVSS